METTQVYNPTDRLINCMTSLNEIRRKHHHYIKTKYKITGMEMEIIQWLFIEGPRKMKEIGENFNIKLSSLTSVIDKIERQKLVYRKNSKDDRRVVFLDVSEKGKRLYRDYSDYLKVLSHLMKKEMNERDFEAFILGIEKMLKYSEQNQN
ncbi:MAG: MarR family winged helix-turn-helix transcriptional regulator [Bacteroidota bacterium]